VTNVYFGKFLKEYTFSNTLIFYAILERKKICNPASGPLAQPQGVGHIQTAC
jgi:hypothetical protein